MIYIFIVITRIIPSSDFLSAKNIYKIIGRKTKIISTIFSGKQKIIKTLTKSAPNTYNKLRLDNFPTKIQIQTQSLCNSECIMCPYKDVYKKLPQGKMDKELFEKIITECSKHKIKKIVPFLMAEPILDNDIFYYIDFIKKRIPKSVIEISTNGTALTKQKAESLAKSKVDMVVFNFQGIDKKSYEETMVGLNYEKTLENINYYLSLEKPHKPVIRIIALIGALSEEKTKKFINYWEKRGQMVELHRIHNRAGNLNTDKVSYETTNIKRVYGCEQERHLKWFHILFNGDVILCCQDWERNTILGNIKNNTIESIWNSEKYKNIRKLVANSTNQNFICNKCFFGIG